MEPNQERIERLEARFKELDENLGRRVEELQAQLKLGVKSHAWRQFALAALSASTVYPEEVPKIADNMLAEYLKRFPLDEK